MTPPENAAILTNLENVPEYMRTFENFRANLGIGQQEQHQHEVAHRQISHQLSRMSVQERGEETPEGSEASSDAFETASNASSVDSAGNRRRRRKGTVSAATKTRLQKERNIKKHPDVSTQQTQPTGTFIESN